MEPSPAMSDFDLDKYLRASKKVDLSGVRWERIKEHPLPVGEARSLAYMMDIETHTVIFLRDLLATRAAFEPDVTAFLSCWVYEELWHGEAFSRFLGEAGYDLAPDGERVWGDAPYPSRIGRNAWIRRKLGGRGYVSHLATLAARHMDQTLGELPGLAGIGVCAAARSAAMRRLRWAQRGDRHLTTPLAAFRA
jgi:hypothetical protein